MARNLDWRRARKRPIVDRWRTRDELARRAEQAMRDWSRSIGRKEIELQGSSSGKFKKQEG
jgi:hypothetical protein